MFCSDGLSSASHTKAVMSQAHLQYHVEFVTPFIPEADPEVCSASTSLHLTIVSYILS